MRQSKRILLRAKSAAEMNAVDDEVKDTGTKKHFPNSMPPNEAYSKGEKQ
jgi:hypothetical protein